MKKILTLIVGLLLIGFTSQAQSGLISFGVKGGVGASKFEGDLQADTENIASWHVGGMFRTNVPVLPIYAQVEALYSRVGGKVDGDASHINRFDVPILAGFKIGLLGINARAFGGAVAQANLSSDNISDLDGFTWGWQAGIGADIKRLTADIKYESGSDFLSGQTGLPSIKSTQWIVSIGWFFGGGDD